MFWRALGLSASAHSVHSMRIFDRRLIELYGVSYNKYADDTQLYTALTANPNACIDRLESCSTGLQRWFCENDLLLNHDKSEVCLFGTRQKLRHVDKPSSIKVAGCCIHMCKNYKHLVLHLIARSRSRTISTAWFAHITFI